MADETKTKSEAAKTKKAGFDDQGKAYPGVDPDTGERITVTLEGLKKEFGPKSGEMKFRQIGQLAGVIDGLAPLESQAATAGGIQIAGTPQDMQFKINEILTAKE